jgi:rhomboid family GlyGly-CTERM serine protease
MITADREQSSVAAWWGPLILAASVVLLLAGGEAPRSLLCFDRTLILSGEWWRLLTGSLVHLGWYHGLLNLLGLLVLVLLCPQTHPLRVWMFRVGAVSMLMSLGLLVFVPALNRYVGLSGTLHGLFLLGLVPQARRGDLISLGCLLYLAGKLGYELWAGAPVSDEQALGGRVIVESHLCGTLAGLIYGLATGAFRAGYTDSKPHMGSA